jgi:predicted transcriptional regulator of viral defense system
MKRALLNEQEGKLLENIVVRFGMTVSFKQVFELLKNEYSREYSRKIVSRLTQRGWLVRLKNGFYSVSDIFNRGNVATSQYVIANTIGSESYVSFGLALQFYNMYDQLLNTITSVSLKQCTGRQISGFDYKFISTQKKYYFGWQTVNLGSSNARIAFAEKALIDMVQFSRTTVSVDLVIEKIQNHKEQINFARLESYLKKSSKTTEKIFGFIFDLLKIDSTKLYKDSKQNTSTVFIDNESKIYNAKWNLYYNEIFNKYL